MYFPNLLIKNIGKLVLASKEPMGFRKGPELARYPSIEHAYLTIQQGRIQAFGPMGECPADPVNVLDAGGGYVLPSFVDCHTHLVFAAWREQEFSDRIRGLSYQEISAKGGGILNSARRLADLSEDELFERSAERVVQAIRTGTGALEIKSGYGLSTESELKILRVIRRLKLNFPIPIQATFLGAHSYPLEYRNDHAAYIKTITTEMIPQIAKEQLAEYCDVFCEQNFFSPDETDAILEAAGRHGLKARVHTNQFTHSGGIDVALKHRAVSVDHLELCSDEEIEQLKNSSTHPVLLPAAAFFMNLHYPPARKMIDRGLGIILATDFNPGTSPSTSMPFVWSLGCIKMKLLPEEALQAMTINPAHNMGIADQVGSIETGKWANLMITQPVPSLDFLPYSFGNPWLAKILIRGNPEF